MTKFSYTEDVIYIIKTVMSRTEIIKVSFDFLILYNAFNEIRYQRKYGSTRLKLRN